MSHVPTRRAFLQSGTTTGALLGLGNLGFLSQLRPVSAAEAALDSNVVQLKPEIAPVVHLIEETPREQLLEEVASRINLGRLSYRELLAGLLLSGVKNVEPRPSVGHKFHTVLVVNSAHLASMSSPAEHRWLPIFWALDYYKSAAARDVVERGDWTMQRVDEAAVPTSGKALQEFDAAMESWDASAADAAIVGFARAAGASRVYERLFRYGIRDFRSIGHKAIYVANSWRTLQCIGWQHSEPVLRSLVYALQMHEGENPSKRDADADRPFRRNAELANNIRSDWQSGSADNAATQDLVEGLQTGSPNDVCDLVVEQLNRGVAPQSIWDALFVSAGELLMRQPAIVALHAVTTTNAIHFAYTASGEDETRRLSMLQNAAFLAMFREAMRKRGAVSDKFVDKLESTQSQASGAPAVDEIFAALSDAPDTAASKVLTFLKQTGSARDVIDAARVLVFLKGNNAHDYKFSSAVLEDYYAISPHWRDTYLASNMYMLRGSQSPDNNLVARTRAALEA